MVFRLKVRRGVVAPIQSIYKISHCCALFAPECVVIINKPGHLLPGNFASTCDHYFCTFRLDLIGRD